MDIVTSLEYVWVGELYLFWKKERITMQQDEIYEIDLMKIWELIKKYWIRYVIVCGLCGVVAISFTVFLMKKLYTAQAKVIIVQEYDQTNQTITYNDVQLSQKLVDTYSQIIRSETILDLVVENLNLHKEYGIDTKSLNEILQVSSANNTEVINVRVETENPELSAQITNEVVDVFQEKIYGIMKIENVTVLDRAKVPTSPSSPSVSKNALLGILVGIILCGAFTIYKVLTDTKIKTEEELKNVLDYPIIGVIPDYDFDQDGGKL